MTLSVVLLMIFTIGETYEGEKNCITLEVTL